MILINNDNDRDYCIVSFLIQQLANKQILLIEKLSVKFLLANQNQTQKIILLLYKKVF